MLQPQVTHFMVFLMVLNSLTPQDAVVFPTTGPQEPHIKLAP